MLNFLIFLVTDLLYKQTLTVNNSTLEVEIVDVCSSGENQDELLPEEPVYWADACVVVYDVTSASSLKYAADILNQVQQLRTQNQIPTVLLGNKADLEHLREVSHNINYLCTRTVYTSSGVVRASRRVIKEILHTSESLIDLVFLNNKPRWQKKLSFREVNERVHKNIHNRNSQLYCCIFFNDYWR